MLDKEQAVETSMAIRERVEEQQEERRVHGRGAVGGKNVCVMVDGSYNSITALRWVVGWTLSVPLPPFWAQPAWSRCPLFPILGLRRGLCQRS